MIKKSLASALATVVIASISVAGAQAATSTNTPNGLCTKSGAVTTISGKSYICTKVLSGKLVWITGSASPSVGGGKPQISGGANGEGGSEGVGNQGEEQGSEGGARQAGLIKYNACLVAHGGTALVRLGKASGVKPANSAIQTKAIAACTSLAPKLRPRGDN